MKKVLIFKNKGIAYDSTSFFAEQLGICLEESGICVNYFDFSNETSETLEHLCNASYDALIDFNSQLPAAVFDDNSYFLDHINAPFFNYILDHPIYHHGYLSYPLKNYHVICIDNDHKSYIQKWYPHIKDVLVLPIGAAKAEISDIKKEQVLLFPATYLNPKDYYEVITALPADMKKNIINISDILIADTACTFENAAMQVYKDTTKDIPFSIFAQTNFLADIYIRAYFREKVLEAAVKSKIAVKVCGEKYNESSIGKFSNVTILPQCSYKKSLSLISQSTFVLNVMPWFKSGIHDRVLNTMYNNSISVTDSSRMMEKYFVPNQDYIEYSINNTEELPDILNYFISKKNIQKDMMICAKEKAAQFTFCCQAEILKEIL